MSTEKGILILSPGGYVWKHPALIRRRTIQERKNLTKWRRSYVERIRIAERDVYGEER